MSPIESSASTKDVRANPAAFANGNVPALTCRWCGQVHAPVKLGRGQRALCVRCRIVLARKSWIGPGAALAFTITALICAIPALILPIATVSKFGSQHDSTLFTGIVALWRSGMPFLAVWTALCGVITPVLLLGVLAGHTLPGLVGRHGVEDDALARTAHALEHWAMPEVQILAVLVSFVKLGSLVDVAIGPGLWCYGAMSLATLLAWRSFELEPTYETETLVSPVQT